MSYTLLSDDYRFFRIRFSQYHHTDSSGGCDLHFLALMVKGHAKIVTAEETLTIRQGDAFYFPKGLKYHSYWYGEPEIEFLSFGFSAMPAGDRKNYVLQTLPEAAALGDRLRKIPTRGKDVDSHTLSLFYDALAKAAEHLICEPAKTGHALADHAARYMRKHPYASMPEVSAACDVSQPHLYATFREVTGSTPNDYRQSVLCQKAVELLTTTDKTVEEISTLLQFSSAAYLRKVLHKHTGKTPRQIRQSRDF